MFSAEDRTNGRNAAPRSLLNRVLDVCRAARTRAAAPLRPSASIAVDRVWFRCARPRRICLLHQRSNLARYSTNH